MVAFRLPCDDECSLSLAHTEPLQNVYSDSKGRGASLASLLAGFGITQFARRPFDVVQHGKRLRTASDPLDEPMVSGIQKRHSRIRIIYVYMCDFPDPGWCCAGSRSWRSPESCPAT